jgi:hypothetical protein
MDAASEKQLDGMAAELVATYSLILRILSGLPVPMNLPRLAGDPSRVLHPLSVAWDLAAEEPLPAVTVARIRTMITAWAGAYEIMVIGNGFGPAPWRVRAVDDAADRIRAAAFDIDRHLAGDFRNQEVTDAEREEQTAMRGRRKPRKRRRR